MGKELARTGKRFTLFNLNEDIDDIKTVELPENSGLLNDGASKTVEHEIKSKKLDFFL